MGRESASNASTVKVSEGSYPVEPWWTVSKPVEKPLAHNLDPENRRVD